MKRRSRNGAERSSGLFGVLDDFLVVRILEHLVEFPSVLAKFGGTCRRMRRVVLGHPAELWSFADPGTMAGSLSSTLPSLAGPLTLGPRMTADEALELVRAMPNLRTARFVALWEWKRTDVVRVLKSLPSSLESLSLSFYSILPDDLEMALGLFLELRSLRLESMGNYDDSPGILAVALSRAPQGLQRLEVNSEELAWPGQLVHLPVRENLLELSIDSEKWDGKAFDCSVLPNLCPNLVCLHLDLQTACSGVRCLAMLKHLTDISLSLDGPPEYAFDWFNDRHYGALAWSSNLGVAEEKYRTMDACQKNLVWHTNIAKELENLGNAGNCVPFERVALFGFRVDLSGFFAGMRCQGHLRSLELGCWVPERCREMILDRCATSLAKMVCSGEVLEYLVSLISRPEAQRPLMREICLHTFDQHHLSRVAELLKNSTTVTRLQISLLCITIAQLSAVLATSLPRLEHLTLFSCKSNSSDLRHLVALARSHPRLRQLCLHSVTPVPRPRGLPSNVALSVHIIYHPRWVSSADMSPEENEKN